MKNNIHAEFPSFITLLKRTWNILTKILLSLFVFNIAIQGAILALSFFFLLFVGVNLLSNFLQGVPQKNLLVAAFTSGSPGLMLILAACLVYVIAVVLTLVLQIGNTLIIANHKEKFSFGNIFNKSLSLFLPLFTTSILYGLIVFGGAIVFIVPAIIFSFIFMFYSYEVILNKKRGMGALKNSLAIVSNNFGAIFLKLLLLLLLFLVLLIPYFIIISILAVTGSWFESLVGSNIGIFKIVLAFFPNLLAWIIGWYVSIFVFLLYDEAKSRTNLEKPVNMKWALIISVIGWIIGVMVLATVIMLAPK